MQLFSFPDQKSVWGRNATIAVCWEDVAPEQQSFRARVKRDIANSWGAAAAVEFSGWELRPENTNDVWFVLRLRIPTLTRSTWGVF